MVYKKVKIIQLKKLVLMISDPQQCYITLNYLEFFYLTINLPFTWTNIIDVVLKLKKKL